VLYVCNVEEDNAGRERHYPAKVASMAAEKGAEAVIISAKIESEIALMDDPADKAEFLETMGLTEPGLNKIIRAGYKLCSIC
jgi:Predicted GTPase, probable translation factor